MHFNRNLAIFTVQNVKADGRLQLFQGDFHRKKTADTLKLSRHNLSTVDSRDFAVKLLIQRVVNNLRKVHNVIFAYLCSLQVIVTVLDDNDHPPVFTRSNYEFQVAENVNIGHLVGTVTASDNDEGVNAKISFLINVENGSKCNMLNKKIVLE